MVFYCPFCPFTAKTAGGMVMHLKKHGVAFPTYITRYQSAKRLGCKPSVVDWLKRRHGIDVTKPHALEVEAR